MWVTHDVDPTVCTVRSGGITTVGPTGDGDGVGVGVMR
jgi:hypothetical protein